MTQPREIPILRNGDQVRAILAGATQMRVPCKTQPETYEGESGLQFELPGWHGSLGADRFAREFGPFGAPGDVLYCKETWACTNDYDGNILLDGRKALYRADDPNQTSSIIPSRWRSSVHMPKAVARTWLRVTRVWVEQVQSISEADAITEGVEDEVWDSTYGKKHPWSANPWVFGCEFERIDKC